MSALNNICEGLPVEINRGGVIREPSQKAAAMRQGVRDGLRRESFRLRFGPLTTAEASALRAVLFAFMFSARFPWTPPGESADRSFRFAPNYQETRIGGNSVEVQAELVALPTILFGE